MCSQCRDLTEEESRQNGADSYSVAIAEMRFALLIRLHPLPHARGNGISVPVVPRALGVTRSAPTLADAAHLTPPGIDAATGAAGSEMLSAVFFPILNAGSLNAGACRFASPGSHASHQAAARLGPPGFDPIAQEFSHQFSEATNA